MSTIPNSNFVVEEAAAVRNSEREGHFESAHSQNSSSWEHTSAYINLTYQIDDCIAELKSGNISQVFLVNTKEIVSDGENLWVKWMLRSDISEPLVSLGEYIEKKHSPRFGIKPQAISSKDFGGHYLIYVIDREAISRKDEGFIENKITDIEALNSLKNEWSSASDRVRNSFLAYIQKEGRPEGVSTAKWADRVQPRKATADVELPESAPELWVRSSEKKQLDAGSLKLDDALLAFTKRVYAKFLRSDDTGISVPEIPDEQLREEWVKLRKRFRGRKEELPEDCRVPAKPERNKALIDKILAGELLPPKDYRAFINLNNAAKKHGLSIAKSAAVE